MIDSNNSLASPTPMWQGVSDPMPVPDTSMLPQANEPASAADEVMKRTVQGVHTAIDRLADKVAPTVLQLGESVASAEGALHAKAEQFRETRDQWSGSLRTAVRKNPLAFLAGALAAGALITRITR